MRIGLVIGMLNNDLGNIVIRRVSEEISSRNAQLVVIECCDIDFNTPADLRENLVLKVIGSELIDGIIIATSTIPGQDARNLLETVVKGTGKPVVSIGERLEGIPSFVFDYQAGFSSIIEHFLSHNINNFAFVSGPLSNLDNLARHDAFIEAAQKHGIEVPQHLMLEGTSGYMSGYNCAWTLVPLIKNGSVRAVICSDDEIAISVIKCLRDNGISIPEDVSVSGFDDSTLAGYNRVLTTVDKGVGHLVEKSVTVLFQHIFGRREDYDVHTCIPGLVIGKSCGCDVREKPDDLVLPPWTRFYGLKGRISRTDEKGSAALLAGYLDENNVNQCYIVYNADPDEYTGQDGLKCRLFFGYSRGKTVSYTRAFPIDEILPRHILSEVKEHLAIKPLVMNRLQLGLLIISINNVTGALIDDLAAELCRSLVYIYSIKKKAELEKKISDVHDSLMISNRRLNELTVKDNLDKLANIRHLASKMLKARNGSSGEYVLIIVEIDNYNEINSRYGFNEGEFVLSCVSDILSRSIRDDDFLIHQYCERYVLLVKNIQKDPTEIITKRFTIALDELNSRLKKPYVISLSWGCAQASLENDFEQAYNQAEQALLQNKQKNMLR